VSAAEREFQRDVINLKTAKILGLTAPLARPRRRGDRVTLRRREFITLLGGAAVAWPVVASAQQSGRIPHVGVLLNTGSDDLASQARLAGFLQGRRRQEKSKPALAQSD
jgi:hypothetical protein